MEKLDRNAFSYEEPQKGRYNVPMGDEDRARCETCHYYVSPKQCQLYIDLNQSLPEAFEVQEGVQPEGYCKGFVAMEKNSTDGLRRKASMLARKEKDEPKEKEEKSEKEKED